VLSVLHDLANYQYIDHYNHIMNVLSSHSMYIILCEKQVDEHNNISISGSAYKDNIIYFNYILQY